MTTQQHGAPAEVARSAEADVQLSPPAVLLILVVLLMPFPLVLKKFTSGNAGYDFQAILFPSDIPLALLTIAMIPRVVARVRGHTLGLIGGVFLVLLTWLAIAFAVHPSPRGVADLARLAGVLAMVVAMLELRTRADRILVLGSVASVAMFELVVGVIQVIRNGPVGLYALGESREPLYSFGNASASQGTMVHPYLLAGLAALTGTLLAAVAVRRHDERLRLSVAAAFAVASVGFTYSRAALLGFAVAVVCLASGLLGDRRRYLAPVISLCVGAAVPALIWNGGWVSRARQSTAAHASSGLTTDRGWLIHEADGLIADQPLVGVGPGRYVIALRDKFGTEPNKNVQVFKPVHNLPLLLAAEGGIPAGLLMTALLLAAGWRAFRAGRGGLAVYVAYLPLALLDHFPYSFPQGLVLTGIWLGAIELLARQPAER